MKTIMQGPQEKRQEPLQAGWSPKDENKIKRILVVDDELRIREIYRSLFKILGFHVYTAETASEACVILATEKIDIIILDIHMSQPVRPVLYQVIRHFNKSMKIIVSSAYSVTEQKKAFEYADGYFDKADHHETLVRMVDALMKPSS